ncbi:uncharacterized protein LOC143291308 isoform X2 [Babylonia areolata]|uniref:uncharacterized protein LOC143291308 isoform X2 n=1 Tax=Babylonia areolata TaxID=304850 RepID=UPI003FD49827
MFAAVVEKVGWLYGLAVGELTWGTVCVYGAILFFSWVFSRLVISPQLSPLKKIPGAAESWYHLLFGHIPEILRREPIDPFIDWVTELKTGIVRYRSVFGRYRVMVADADAFKDVLVTNTKHYPRPSFIYRVFEMIAGKTSLLSTEGAHHTAQRRLCSPAFKMGYLEGLLPVFQKKAEQLCAMWGRAIDTDSQSEGTAQVDVHSTSSNLTLDVLNQSGLGYHSNALEDPADKMHQALRNILQRGRAGLLRVVIPSVYSRLPTEGNRKFAAGLGFINSLIKKIVGEKEKAMEESERSGRDLLETLLLATDGETGDRLSDVELRDHVMTFMIAGHETSASSLCWILLTLATRPDVQAKARQEVMSHLPPSGQPITLKDLDQMPYVNCVVKEVMRLYPPVPTVMRIARRDMMMCGYQIPQGTVITLSIGALHRNPAYWENPDEFHPERFLDESSVPFYAYQPFISGPHMCLGYRFAMLELRLFVAVLLSKFEFSPLPGVTYRKTQTFTLRPTPELWLTLKYAV